MSHRSVAAWTTDNRWSPAVCAGRSSMALFTLTAKLDPGAHGSRCAWAMAVHHAVGISRQRNSGYKASRVNIMARGLSTPDPSLNPTPLYKEKLRNNYTLHTPWHHQVSLMVLLTTTLVPFLGLRIGPACEAGLIAGMRRERIPPQRRKKEQEDNVTQQNTRISSLW